jgi:hypothetical protein
VKPVALFIAVALARAAVPGVARAQASDPDTLSNAGVVRAAVLVDSVFVKRTRPLATIGGGDWTSYMMARLGIRPIPPGTGIHVDVDTARIELAGTIGELPPEAQAELKPLFTIFGPSTPYTADVTLFRAGAGAVRFRLHSVSINRIPIPDAWLQGVMTEVGKQYPALTQTGRDLFVAIPRGGAVRLVAGGVRLVSPGADSSAASSGR